MVGRKNQIDTMTELLKIDKSYFVAVTGRRRVGKTYLINYVYKEHICLEVTGIQQGSQKSQIINFIQKLAEYSNLPIVSVPQNWQQVFLLLKKHLEALPKNKKHVIFIDELPWMATVRSGFIQLLAHLWNDYISKEKNFILVICGSATSWINKKIINDKGGFHNRITHHIHLLPFTLSETKEFLYNRNIKFSEDEIAELYMAFGGIPYYLGLINKGESVAESIDRLCFGNESLLRNEYNNLYKALFEQSNNHELIVSALAKAKYGLNRNDLSKKAKVIKGGPFSRAMEDLILTGFIVEQFPFGKIKQGSVFRLVDEFSVFYHRFISSHKRSEQGIWHEINKTQSYKIWLGFAFEALCMKHIDNIKKALGISKVYTEISSFHYTGNTKDNGVQIDLVIDRGDKSVSLCECKYYTEAPDITKQLAASLNKKKELFKLYSRTKKNIFTVLICNRPVKKNDYYYESIDKRVLLEELF